MKPVAHVAMAVLFCGSFLPAQTTPPATEPTIQPLADSFDAEKPLDIVSDTMGVDFGPYLRVVAHDVRTKWYSLVPEKARTGFNGKVTIQFAILKDGTVDNMKVTETSGDESLDRAALGGITKSIPFAPLPEEFGGKFVVLRFRFYYNPDVGQVSASPLTSGITVTVSPSDGVDVPLGASLPVIATVKGTKNLAFIWGLTGAGCSHNTCGRIDDSGVYVAPSRLPDPPLVTVTAYSKADPDAFAWVIVHLVSAPKP